MRICFMAYDRPAYAGGPIINARRILPELVRRGHTVLALLGYHEDYPNAQFLEEQGVEISVCEFAETEVLMEWIFEQLNQFQPDVFVPNISVAGGFVAKWAKQANIATIISHRSDDEFNWGLAKMFGFGDDEWQTSGLMCVSHYLKNQVQRKADKPVNIKVIPSGVPIPEAASNQSISENFNVIYSGRLEQNQKRIWDTVEAFVAASKQNEYLRFTLLGEGSQKQKLNEYISEQNLQDRITIKNKLTGQAYHEELIKHHVIVLMSDFEGTPGSIMDGMACGLVPVCYAFAGIDELVQHEQTGLLINNRKEGFFESLTLLQKNGAMRKSLAKNARQHVRQNYSLKVATDRWESFFDTLVSNQRKDFKVPDKLNLPPVMPELSREDRRKA